MRHGDSYFHLHLLHAVFALIRCIGVFIKALSPTAADQATPAANVESPLYAGARRSSSSCISY